MIFNITFHLDKEMQEEALNWIKQTYITEATKGNLLTNPHLYQVRISHNEGTTYATHFEVESMSSFHQWYTQMGRALEIKQQSKFGEKVLSISTMLDEIDLK